MQKMLRDCQGKISLVDVVVALQARFFAFFPRSAVRTVVLDEGDPDGSDHAKRSFEPDCPRMINDGHAAIPRSAFTDIVVLGEVRNIRMHPPLGRESHKFRAASYKPFHERNGEILFVPENSFFLDLGLELFVVANQDEVFNIW